MLLFVSTGAAGGILKETARYINGERVNPSSVARSLADGMLFGSAVAMPTQISKYLQHRAIDLKLASELEVAKIELEAATLRTEMEAVKLRSENEVAQLKSEIEAVKMRASEMELASLKAELEAARLSSEIETANRKTSNLFWTDAIIKIVSLAIVLLI